MAASTPGVRWLRTACCLAVASASAFVPTSGHSSVARPLASFPSPCGPLQSLSDDDDGGRDVAPDVPTAALFGTVGVAYWYLVVLAAAADANGLPVPDFVPLVPGWPASERDFVPVVEDSYHFFYLSELLQSPEAPYVSPVRLGVFNFVEAWIFALLPLLWSDPRRLPRPVLAGSWATLGIGLTNAFLAPYLFLTELRSGSTHPNPKNRTVSASFAVVASAVVAYAVFSCATTATDTDWSGFWQLAQQDRSYLAFCIDPVLLSVAQPFLLNRVRGGSNRTSDYLPFVGTVAWLLEDDRDTDSSTNRY